jgi:hypothetical protein
MNFNAIKPFAAAALALAAGAANADTVNFDSPSRTLLGHDLGKTVVDGDFTFISPKNLRAPSFLTVADPHGETLSDTTGALLSVGRTDGAGFDLESFQLADALNVGIGGTVVLSYVIDGVTHDQNLSVDTARGLQTFTFDFDDVTSFTLKGKNSFGFQLDNLDTTAYVAPTVVPEPGSLALLMAGLGVLATVARRRKA